MKNIPLPYLTGEFMNDDFGYWFSGVTDGEGCFAIQLNKPYGRRKIAKYSGWFAITLRADDINVIKSIKETLGFGNIYHYKNENRKTPNSKPFVYYKVSTIDGCCKLIDIFDKYKLRSKKLNDYNVWKQFILYKKNNFNNYENRIDYVETLENYYYKIKEVRVFTEV